MRFSSVLLTALLLAGVGACSDGTGPATPASVQVLDGDGQAARAFSAVPDPLRVRVTDRAGGPMAGITVRWSAAAGTLSHAESVTDADGVASVGWTFRDPGSDAFQLGTHQVRAEVGSLPAALFSGRAGRGIDLVSAAVSPAQVDVSSGPATVTVTVRATDDVGDISDGAFRFGSPSGVSTPSARFTLSSGSGKDGTWQGTVQIPQGAEAGLWKLQLSLRDSRHEVSWFSETLQGRGMAYGVTVTAGP